MKTWKQFKEDAPVNCVGGGNIAGMGVGPQGEPGVMVPRRKRKKAPKKVDEGAMAQIHPIKYLPKISSTVEIAHCDNCGTVEPKTNGTCPKCGVTLKPKGKGK